MSKYPKGCDGNYFEWYVVEKDIDGISCSWSEINSSWNM